MRERIKELEQNVAVLVAAKRDAEVCKSLSEHTNLHVGSCILQIHYIYVLTPGLRQLRTELSFVRS